MTHQEWRETNQWGTYGKNGDEPLTWISIKDISNNHLENIILFIKESPRLTYSHETITHMLTEKKFRENNNIFVPEYNKQITKPFIKGLKNISIL